MFDLYTYFVYLYTMHRFSLAEKNHDQKELCSIELNRAVKGALVQTLASEMHEQL